MKRLVLLLLLLLSAVTGRAMAAVNSNIPDSLSVKIGQMVMVGFRGCSLAEAPDVAGSITRQHIGGVVLFDYDMPTRSYGRNIKNAEQLARLCNDLQQLSSIPLLIAIDQEGGRVSRLKTSCGFPPTISAAALGALDSPDSTRAVTTRSVALLHQLHIGMNFAPVADINSNPDNPVIGRLDRSYSADPQVVTAMIRLMLPIYRNHGVVPVLKHFPGHGSSTADSHLGFTDVTATWNDDELLPYRELVDEGYDGAIMTAHVFNARLDGSFPATISTSTLDGLLRQRIGFDGVIVSDDMQMKAIADHYGLEVAIERAILAGVDILLFANNSSYEPDIAERTISIIRSLIATGRITPDRIDRSYNRIIALKQRYSSPRP